MTVAELIAELSQMPPNAQVCHYHPEDEVFRGHVQVLREVILVGGVGEPHVEMEFE